MNARSSIFRTEETLFSRMFLFFNFVFQTWEVFHRLLLEHELLNFSGRRQWERVFEFDVFRVLESRQTIFAVSNDILFCYCSIIVQLMNMKFLLLWHTKSFAKNGCSVAKLKARSEASRQESKFKRF